MNIEELELSLRSEFESEMTKVLAGVKKDADEFKKHFETEFEKHRAELDRAIDGLSARIQQGVVMDAPFTESINEHLRLARDDGAQVAATAFGEAEKLKESTSEVPRYDLIRDAIGEISTKTSQAAILRSLVDHAGSFAKRGAFFIARNDQLIGWSAFGAEAHASEESAREIQLEGGSDTILSTSVASLCVEEAVGGSHTEDGMFLDPLGFGQPEKMYAIPLVARGRGVAVLYADTGLSGASVNLEALETLVRVAGLTVELLAAAQMPRTADAEVHSAVDPEVEQAETVQTEAQPETLAAEDETPTVEPEPVSSYVPVEELQSETFAHKTAPFEETVAVEDVQADEPVAEYIGGISFRNETAEPEVERFEPVSATETQEFTVETNSGYSYEAEPAEAQVTDFAFESNGGSEAAEPEIEMAEPFVESTSDEAAASVAVEEPAYATNGNTNGHVQTEPVVEVKAPSAGRTRLSDRNVDLPIEVADEERRLHNDARRFARLLVSEIKLYNGQKVEEGRESSDLYERLREAIDRSREMYDKRVQPAVASKFDYFHYELVNSLAEGEPNKLGAGYPGEVV